MDNKALTEPFSELLDTTFAKLKIDLDSDGDSLSPQENNEFGKSYMKQNMINMNKVTATVIMEQINATIGIICQVRSELEFLMIKTLCPLTLKNEVCYFAYDFLYDLLSV